jgi:alkaline phosphatase D
VASGDPLSDRVIIWTRVTPAADATPGSGKGGPVSVRYEVAHDRAFTSVLRSGSMTASAAGDHTVKVDIAGLPPATDHWYRFSALGATSPVGRTRTAPAAGSTPDAVRLGVVTCSEWEFGFFSAYRHLAARDDVDAVLHLGDYIYEFGIGYGAAPGVPTPGPALGRTHTPTHECLTLADYRTRYGQYRTDPDLQALHAAHPMIAMYDDHEVANDTWRAGAQNHQPEEGSFAVRAAAGHQAWREWLPMRPVVPDPEVVHRSFRFGTLVELWMLDERRYRDQQPENAFFGYGSVDAASEDPSRTMLGPAQRDWLVNGLRASTAAWKVVGNPDQFMPLVLGPAFLNAVTAAVAAISPTTVPLPPPLGVDGWDGYAAERRALIGAIASKPVADVVVLTGDYHESFVSELPVTVSSYPLDGKSAAVEFVVPPVNSPSLGETFERGGLPNGTPLINTAFEADLLVNNPWVKYHEGLASGFGVVEFSAAATHYDFVFVSNKLDRAATAAVGASWQVARGTGKATVAAGPLAARVRSSGTVAPATPVPSATGPLAATGRAAPLMPAAALAAAALAARRLRER